jgi:hypothetical protein
MTTADVAASGDRIEAGPMAIGDAQTRTDPSTENPSPKTSNPGRQAHPERRQQLPTDPRLVLGTSCTVNPMLDRNARLVPIDY